MELKFIFNKTLHLIKMKINGKRLFWPKWVWKCVYAFQGIIIYNVHTQC